MTHERAVVASRVARRARWLGHPEFVGAVALLLVNDHVLKAARPGWVTGKLSDVAGLAVVAVAAAVLVGRRPGLVLAGLGFTLLKVVPGVAGLVAPVLGGETLRDATDLLALVVLVPLWRWLAPTDATTAPPPPPIAVAGPPVGRRTEPPAWRLALSAALPVVGALTAVLATTATSCAPEPSVDRVAAADGVLHAELGGGTTLGWASSTDGGETWTRGDAPAGVAPRPEGADAPGPDTPYGPLDDCGAEGCVRVRGNSTLEWSDGPGGDWAVARTLSAAERDAASGPCAGGDRGALGSVAVDDDGPGAVAALGGAGVLVRADDGEWDRRPVLGADAEPPVPLVRSPWLWLMLAAGPVGIAGAFVAGRHRTARWVGAWVAVGGVAVGLGVGLVLAFGDDTPGGPVLGVVAVLIVAGASGSARAVGLPRPAAMAPPGWPPGGHLPPPPR